MRKFWLIKWYDATGKPCKIYGNMNSLPTKALRLKEANRLIAEILSPGIKDDKRKTDLVGQLSDLLEYKKPMMEWASYTSYSTILRAFALWYRKARAENKDTVAGDYIRHMHVIGLHKNTIRNRLMVLRGLVKELIPHKQLHNPFDGIKAKRVKAQSKLPFTDNQLMELLPVVEQEDPQLRDAIDFCFYLFFRPKEIRALKISHILFEPMQVIASDDVLKDDDNYLKAIPLGMYRHIEKYKGYPPEYYIFSKDGLPGPERLSRDHISRRMTDILRRLNYHKRYTLYSFVHTGIMMAERAGIPHKQLQLQKGHANLQMLEEYLKDIKITTGMQLVNDFPSLPASTGKENILPASGTQRLNTCYWPAPTNSLVLPGSYHGKQQ